MKRIIVIALIVVVALAALAVAAPLVISVDFVKTRIAGEFIRWTGREVTYSGEPRITLYPYLTVRLRDAVIADQDGGDNPFIEMDALAGKLEILPLLLGRAEVAEFRMTRPRINLRIDSDGHPNWLPVGGIIGTQAAKRDAEIVSDDIAPSSPPAAVQLGRLRIRDGTITFNDERSGDIETLTNANLDVTWPNTAGAASGSGGFNWRDETVEFNGSVATPLRLLSGGASAMRLAIAAKPIRFSFDGTAQQLDALQLDGKVNVTTPSVRGLANWAGAALPTGSSLGAGSISGSMNWIDTSVSLTDATIELDGNAADGAINIGVSNDRLSVQGTLAFAQLDLTPYFEAFRAELFNAGPWLAAPARLPVNDNLDFDVRISADALITGSVVIDEVAASASLKNGKLTIDIGDANFYDGRIEARLTAQENNGELMTNAALEVDGIPVRAAMADLFGVAAVDGVAAGSFEATARGETWGEFMEQLEGMTTLAVADGVVTGMDVTELPNLIRDPELLPGGGSTEFAAANCSMTIADGHVAINSLEVHGPDFAVDLAGKLALFAPTIEARGILSLIPDGDGDTDDALEVPFMISGTWSSPRFLPDLGRPIKRSILEPRRTRDRRNPNG